MTPLCVSVHIVRKTEDSPRYLLIRRCSGYLPGTWQMVTGGILESETAIDAALREVKEETGLEPIHLYSADAVESFYMPSVNRMEFVPVFFAIVEEEAVTLSPSEHDAYEWLKFEDALEKLVWAEQKRVLKQIHFEFILKQPHPLLSVKPFAAQKQLISRTGVYGLAMKEQKLFVAVQKKGPHLGKLDLPGGGLEPGETIEEALRREITEEAAMRFESMELFHNLTETTNGLHRIALIYRIEGLTPLEGKTGELACFWIDIEDLPQNSLSPLLEKCCLSPACR